MKGQRRIALMLVFIFIVSMGMSTAVEAGLVHKKESKFIVESPVDMPIKVYIDGIYEEDFQLKKGENILAVGLDELDGPERYWLELSDEYVGKFELKGSQYKGKTFGLPIYYGGNVRLKFVEVGAKEENQFIVNSPIAMPIKVYIDGVYEEDFQLKEGKNILPVGLDELDGPERYWLELSDDFVGMVELKGSQYKGKTFGLPIYYDGDIVVDFEKTDEFIVNSPVDMPVKIYVDGVYEEDFQLKKGQNILPVNLSQLDGEMFWLELSDDFVGRVEVKDSQYKGKTFGLPIYYGGDLVVDLVSLDKFIVNSPVAMPVKIYVDGYYEEDFDLKEGENILDINIAELIDKDMFWLELSDEFVDRVEVKDSQYKGKTFGLVDYESGDFIVDLVELKEEPKEVEFKLGAARLVDNYELVLDYTKEIEKLDYFKLEFRNQLELIDQDGKKIRLSNYQLRDGQLVANYDRNSNPAKVNVKAEGIFTSIDGDKNKVEENIEITDNRPEIIRAGISVEKLSSKEVRANISFAEDLDIFSLVANTEVFVNGKKLKTNKKFNKTDNLISLGFIAQEELNLGDKVLISFDGVETVAGRVVESFDHETVLTLDKKLDRKIEDLKKEMEDYIFDLTSPVGLLGLTQEMNQKNFWPTPAFENALRAIEKDLPNYEKLVAKLDREIKDIELISGPDYDKLLDLKKDRDYLAKSVDYASGDLLVKANFFIDEANKTEAIKNRMREIAYKMHRHFVHSLLQEPEVLDGLIASIPGEKEEAEKIELDYMKKMAMDDIVEMEAKLGVIKIASDFYHEEDLAKAYEDIDYVKEQIKRLPADVGNELYSFIVDKINLAIDYNQASGDTEAEGVFKVEEVNLLDGNIVEIKLSNPITWYDKDFKEDNLMFVLKTSEEEGYHNFVSVEKTEIELKGKTVRLTPRDGVVASHFEVPEGVPIKDARGMTPEKMGIRKINDLRTK